VRLRMDWTATALVAMTIIMIAPLWSVHAPAMPDYPAHLASFWLIGGGQSPFYKVHWILTPNLASEAIVPLLARLTGLEVAAKLFLSAALAMWALAGAFIQRALFGRLGITPLFGALFAYNANFFWGFFNYYFAAGLALVLFAAWISSELRAGWMRTALFMLGTVVTYFCHVFAALTLIAMIASFEMMRALHDDELWARALRLALLLAPILILFLALKPAGQGMHLAFNLYDTMADRFYSLMLYRFDDPNSWLPSLIGALLLGAVLLRRARLAEPMWLTLVGLVLAALLAPEEAMGGWGVHLRLPALCALLLLAASDVPLNSRMTARLTVLALFLASLSSLSLAASWTQIDRQTTEFRRAEQYLPQNRRLMTVLDGDAIGWNSDPPYWHMAEWAIMDRGAMTALMFTTKGQHVVELRPNIVSFAAATADQGVPPDIDDLGDLASGNIDAELMQTVPYLMYFPCNYDEAVVIHLGGRRSPIPAMLRLRHAGSFFSIYDIAPGQACKTH